ncbi:hypothetical protein PGQ11_010749 [Apiospora arundinis]|uniref:Uncharacterized protein n=1 Tax=Apiospora arundinis TaxID=335852 RepID=A0ABR2IBL8_9PEZI
MFKSPKKAWPNTPATFRCPILWLILEVAGLVVVDVEPLKVVLLVGAVGLDVLAVVLDLGVVDAVDAVPGDARAHRLALVALEVGLPAVAAAARLVVLVGHDLALVVEQPPDPVAHLVAEVLLLGDEDDVVPHLAQHHVLALGRAVRLAGLDGVELGALLDDVAGFFASSETGRTHFRRLGHGGDDGGRTDEELHETC